MPGSWSDHVAPASSDFGAGSRKIPEREFNRRFTMLPSFGCSDPHPTIRCSGRTAGLARWVPYDPPGFIILRATMRTAGVRALVQEVLETMHQPYSHHVIDEVFAAIEQNSSWRIRYDSLCSNLGRDVVNNWGGRWIAITLGKVGEQQVPSKNSRLIGSYSILDTDAKAVTRKPDRAEALQLMSHYHKIHKNNLPTSIRNHRDLIVDLLVAGVRVEDAFSEAMASSA